MDRVATAFGALTALFLLMAILVSQCQTKPTTARLEATNTRHLSLNGDKMMRVSDDEAVVKNYWEF
jgi:hypothetical protein